MVKLALVTAILALCGAQDGRRQATDYPKSGVYWSKSWVEAWEEAWNRNVPVFVAVHQDGSDACAAMAALYREKRFIDASRMWVNIIVHPGTAHDVDVEIGGKKVPRCELYYDIACKDHADAETQFPNVLKKPDELPARIFCIPKDRKEVGREAGVAKIADLLKSMDKVLAELPGEKTSADAWRRAKSLMVEADAALAKKEWQKAVKAYRMAMKLANNENLNAAGQAALDKINAQGELLYKDATGSQPKGGKSDVSATKKKLRKIIEDFRTLPVEAKAREYLESLEKLGH